MPCDSSHMEPNPTECIARESARLLVYACKVLCLDVPEFAQKAAQDYYGSGGLEAIPQLCALTKGATEEQLKLLCSHPDFEDWLNRHKAADREGTRVERVKQLKDSARKKLTSEELQALLDS